MPPPRVTDAYLDEKQTRVIERTTGLLRVFDKDLEQTARQNAVDDIRRSARNSGILKDADERARSQLKNLFHQDLNCIERLTTTAFFLSGQTPATGATAITRVEQTAARLFPWFSAF